MSFDRVVIPIENQQIYDHDETAETRLIFST